MTDRCPVVFSTVPHEVLELAAGQLVTAGGVWYVVPTVSHGGTGMTSIAASQIVYGNPTGTAMTQDAAFVRDVANGRVSLGPIAGFGASLAAMNISDGSVSATLNLQNTLAAGYTAFDLFSSAGVKVGTFAYSNAAAAVYPGAFWFGTRTAAPCYIVTGGVAVRVHITAAGLVGVGIPIAALPAVSAPDALFQVGPRPHNVNHVYDVAVIENIHDPTVLSTVYSPIVRWVRDYSPGQYYCASAEWGIRAYGASAGAPTYAPQTELVLRLKGQSGAVNGPKESADVEVITARANGIVTVPGTLTEAGRRVYSRLLPAPEWVDLLHPASSINPAGIVGPVVYNTAESTWDWRDGSSCRCDMVQQMPHGWVEGDDVKLHLHISPDGSAAGNARWEISYRRFNDGGAPPAWTVVAAFTTAIAASRNVVRLDLLTVTMPGILISGHVQFQVTRTGGHGDDTYGGDLRMFSWDCHTRVNSFGSLTEGAK